MQWAEIMKPEALKKLINHCNEENSKLTDKNTGYDVFRGTDMSNWIHNNLMR